MAAPNKQSNQDLLFAIELLTIPQVAKWAKVSTKSVYRWIEAGTIPAVKFGPRTYRIPEKAIIDYLRQSGYDHLLPSPYVAERGSAY